MDISSLLSPSDDSPSLNTPGTTTSQSPRSLSRPPLTQTPTSSSTSSSNSLHLHPHNSATPVSYRPSPPRITSAPIIPPLTTTTTTTTTTTAAINSTPSPHGHRPRSTSTPTVDQIMADAPPPLSTLPLPPDNSPPPPSDTPPLTDDQLVELERLIATVAEKPYQYSAHLQCIDLLRRAYHSEAGSTPDERQPMLLNLRKAREDLVAKFPMKESMWLEWITDERREMRNFADRLTVMEICGRSVVDQVASTKLWREYARFVEEMTRDAQTKSDVDMNMTPEEWSTFREIFHQDVVVDIYRQGAQATSIDIADSPQIWDRYRDLVMEDLERETTQEKIDNVYKLYEQRLLIPHANIVDTFSAFSQFVTTYDNANYESIMVEYNKIYSISLAKWEEREDVETLLKAQVDLHRVPTPEEWSIWSSYLRRETHPRSRKSLDPEMAKSLFERCLLRFGEQASVWEDYVYFTLETMNDTPMTISLLSRATRSCPWSGTLWAQYIIALERGFKPFEQVSEVKHFATETGLLDLGGTEEIVRFNIAWCGFLKRRAFDPIHGDDEDAFSVAEMGIREATSEMAAQPLARQDPHYRIPRVQINFYTRAKKLDLARVIWEELEKQFKGSYEFWLRYYEWELANGDVKRAGEVIGRAVNRRELDWPEKVIETWRTHVEDYGDVEEVEMMMCKYYRVSRAIQEKRVLEAEKAAVQQQEQPVGEAAVVEGTPTKNKRRRSEAGFTDLEGGGKKVKQEDEEETTAVPTPAIPEHAPPTAAQIAKRDRENLTVIVKNLPPNYPEVKVRQLFRDCGKLNSLSLASTPTSTTATVEFDTKSDVLSAQTKDQKHIDGHTITITVGTGSTLYVTNFPPVFDESSIRNLFSPYGTIVDIRFPSLKFNTQRRFCYIQFAAPEEASSASSALHGKPLGEKETLVALISNPGQKRERTDPTKEGREIYIRNIDFNATEGDVRKLFEPYGEIEAMRLPPGPRKGTHRGFGFITYTTAEAATAATGVSGTQLKARTLDVTIASPNPQKSTAAATTVGAAGVTPDRSRESTPVVNDTTDLRTRTLAVLNLADTVNEARLRAVFEPCGEIKAVTLRPEHGGALVEFTTAADAGKAALKLEGEVILDGKRIAFGEYKDLMRSKGEKKAAKGEFTKKPASGGMMVPSSVRGGRGGARGGRGGRGGRPGLGFSGAIAKKKVEEKGGERNDGGDVKMGGTDGDVPDRAKEVAKAEEEKKGRSNDEFRKMFLK